MRTRQKIYSQAGLLLILAFFSPLILQAQCFTCKEAPAGTIFCDDFEDTLALSHRYFEYVPAQGAFVPLNGVGRDGSRGMRALFQAGQVEAGNLKKSFGRTPSAYLGKHAATPEQDYQEIYWRVDVRLQPGWQGGGGDKLTRVTAMQTDRWAQGAIGHLWSGNKNNSPYLVLDPASGIDAQGRLQAVSYNDFPHLRWLGNQKGNIDLFSEANAGKWFCVEAHIKLNTPGLSDGVFEYWINGSLQASSTNLNWHGSWDAQPASYQLNVIMLENYWNSGSPVKQERYFDNFVISTRRIGCCQAPGHENSGRKNAPGN
ncbi:MAG: hypothetical protein ACO1O1_05830 [Adhaeribacter sp.]